MAKHGRRIRRKCLIISWTHHCGVKSLSQKESITLNFAIYRIHHCIHQEPQFGLSFCQQKIIQEDDRPAKHLLTFSLAKTKLMNPLCAICAEKMCQTCFKKDKKNPYGEKHKRNSGLCFSNGLRLLGFHRGFGVLQLAELSLPIALSWGPRRSGKSANVLRILVQNRKYVQA